MKKLLILPILFLVSLVHGQGVTCLSTQCVATQARAGDTALIGAIFQSDTMVSTIVYKFLSGPNVPTITPQKPAYNTNLRFQVNATVTNLVAGTYLIQVTGTDIMGSSKVGIDSLIVKAAPPTCPPPAIAVSVDIPINGVIFTIPLKGLKVKYDDGSVR